MSLMALVAWFASLVVLRDLFSNYQLLLRVYENNSHKSCKHTGVDVWSQDLIKIH